MPVNPEIMCLYVCVCVCVSVRDESGMFVEYDLRTALNLELENDLARTLGMGPMPNVLARSFSSSRFSAVQAFQNSCRGRGAAAEADANREQQFFIFYLIFFYESLCMMQWIHNSNIIANHRVGRL